MSSIAPWLPMATVAEDRRGRALTLVAATSLLILTMLAALAWGSDSASLWGAVSGAGIERTIIVDFRLPVVLLAALAGGGLAVVGAAFQALLRNPLAEPFVLGVSGGAALGATTAIFLGVGVVGVFAAAVVPLAALCGGLAATAVVYWVARRAPRGPAGASVLLAGVMVNSIASSFITMAKVFVPEGKARVMLRWLVGFVELPTNWALLVAAGYILVGCGVLLLDAGRMNILSLGEESAAALGVDVSALERRVFLASSFVVGAIVSLTGLIGFVGLIVPHAVRKVVGPDHRRLLPLVFVVGASLLVACDLSTRLLFRLVHTKVPVGVLTALIGGPMFLYMLARPRR